MLQRLHVADMVASAVGDQPDVSKAILSQPDIKTPHDLAALNVNKLIRLIDPLAEPGSPAYQQANSQAIAINKQSFAREPLTVLHRMAIENELPIADADVRASLGAFLTSIPADTDIRNTPIHKILTENILQNIPTEQRPAVIENAKAVWRTIAIIPLDEPQALTVLMKTNRTSAFQVSEIPEATFLQVYGESMGQQVAQQVYTNAANARIRNEHTLIKIREALQGTGLAAIDGVKTGEERLADARRVAGANDLPLDFESLFGGLDYSDCEECQSVYSASAYLVELLNFLRNNNLGPDPATGDANPKIQADLKDISGTPLEKLFRRRPDLGNLELTCENTNTVLPYIDLVNEVMESFVVYRANFHTDTHDPKQTTLDVFNVTDETQNELLAQAQHTNYPAYCILKNEAVYPFTLPFHLPIETARIFLKYLGTSRYEVLDSFRSAHEFPLGFSADAFSDTCDAEQSGKRVIQLPKGLNKSDPAPEDRKLHQLHNGVLDRAVDAEFLDLTQEEYIILTKEAFWSKEYFETTQKTVLLDDLYQQTIGVKPVYEYFGYATEADLSDTNEDPIKGQSGLCFVKKEFLPRTGIAFTDLVDLLKTRFINPDYPQGSDLTILENIRYTYRFLQTLVDTSSSDPDIRYGRLITYLETNQATVLKPKNPRLPDLGGQVKAGALAAHIILRNWVINWFEKVGKLIVLESGEGGRHWPITGSLYRQEKIITQGTNPYLIGTIQSDGTILTVDEGVVVYINDAGQMVGSNDVPITKTNPEFTFWIIDNQGKKWWVLDQGIFDENKNQATWQINQPDQQDSGPLDKFRLRHLDGSPLTGKAQLPVEGKLYAAGKFVGTLRKDGTIFDLANAVIAQVTLSGAVLDNNGNIFANDFPPNNILEIMDDQRNRLGWVNANGLMGPREQHLTWLPPYLDEYDRIHRFIRLWRKLGWTINEVDKTLEGLANISAGVNESTLLADGSANKVDSSIIKVGLRPIVLPIHHNVTCDITSDFLHQLAAVKKLLDRTGLPLIKLLSFWSNISTVGEKSLYASLFLTHNMLGIDEVFKADNHGNYLTGSEKIADHLPVLMAALKLKSDQISAIQAMCTPPLDDLTLANVSLLYRFSLLSKILGVKITDLGNLINLFGDPFLDALKTLELFETWGKMEDAGFTFRQLNYVIQNQDDRLNPLAPTLKTVLQTSKTLYDGLNAIYGDNPDVNSAVEATSDLARAEAGQLFPTPVVEQIINLLEGKTVYTTNWTATSDINVPDALASKLAVHKDTIQVTGVLSPDEQNHAKTLSPDQDWKNAIDRVYHQAESFFQNTLAGFLPERATPADQKNQWVHPLSGDVSLPADQIKDGDPDPNTAPQKRFYFLHYFLPFLREQLERRLITDTLSAVFGLPGDVTNVLLSSVLVSFERKPRPAISVLETIRTSHTQTGKGWTGYLIPPADDNYTFVALAPDPKKPDNAPASLTIQGFEKRVAFKNQQADPTNIWSTNPVPLKAGLLYLLTLAVGDVSQLSWRTNSLSTTQIPTSALLPIDSTAGTQDIFIKLSKAAIMVNGFNLSADEVSYFQKHGVDFAGINFNDITLNGWQRIADYVSLREALPKAGKSLLDLFGWASQPDKPRQLTEEIQSVTLWDTAQIDSLTANDHFDLKQPADFKNEVNLIKMQKAIAVANKVGVSIDRLFDWAVPGSKFWPSQQIATDIRMAMRARFDAEDWEVAVKPLNDQLREMQKQALIAFLINQPDLRAWPVLDADSLFEFFLIDVQMGTDRQTTRMVQAISSVQLFIKRCLLGLEDKYGVPVNAIDRKRWEWMEKYRVWEANRKIFLYPENWILPELRDDKSPFYKELESELLQKDINPQTVEEALKNYLYKVDEVANLKVVGLFAEPAIGPDGTELKDGNNKTIYIKLHVFARTRSAPYFFYYRYYDMRKDSQYWYPWEKMQVDITSYDVDELDENGTPTGKIIENGTYLTPVVWHNRLLIFFPQYIKKTVPQPPSKQTIAGMGNATSNSLKPSEMWEIKLAWSEYRKGKWTQKQVSTDAIYSTVSPKTQINGYMFIPTIVTGDPSKVAIDIHNAKPSQPTSAPVTLDKAVLNLFWNHRLGH